MDFNSLRRSLRLGHPGIINSVIRILPDEFVDDLNIELFKRRLRPVLIIEHIAEAFAIRCRTLLANIVAALSRHAAVRPIKCEVFVCLLQDETINARVIPLNGRYIIAVNAGFGENLELLFRGILSLPEVGAIFGLSGESKFEQRSFLTVDKLFDSFISYDLPSINPYAADCARILAHIATDFIAYHEYGHLISGHLDYLLSQGADLLSISEQPVGIADRDLALSRRTLEFDADAFAIIQAYWNAESTSLWNSNSAWILFPHMLQRFKCMYVAIICLFLFFETRRSAATEAELRTHPLPAWRSQFAIGSLMTDACRFTGNSYKEFVDEISGPVLVGVLSAIARCCANFPFALDMLAYYDKNVVFSDTLARWAKLRPLLELHKLAPEFNLAPATVEPR